MKKVPLGPKRIKLFYHHDGIDDYGLKEKEEYKTHDITKQVEKANINANENEKFKKKANNNEKKEKIITNKIEKGKKTKGKKTKRKKKRNSRSKTKRNATEIHSCISWYKSRW